MDIFTPEERSALMSRIRGKNTKPELAVRRLLHSQGFRFRLHRRDLPGTPDIVLPQYRAVVFVHGCFFHSHKGCRFAYIPKTRRSFWRAKFAHNQKRDREAKAALAKLGWNSVVIWECELNHLDKLARRVSRAILQSR